MKIMILNQGRLNKLVEVSIKQNSLYWVDK